MEKQNEDRRASEGNQPQQEKKVFAMCKVEPEVKCFTDYSSTGFLLLVSLLRFHLLVSSEWFECSLFRHISWFKLIIELNGPNFSFLKKKC